MTNERNQDLIKRKRYGRRDSAVTHGLAIQAEVSIIGRGKSKI